MRRVTVLFLACVLAACETGPTAPPSGTPGATASPAPTATPAATPLPTTDPTTGEAGCTPSENPEWSVARRWD